MNKIGIFRRGVKKEKEEEGKQYRYVDPSLMGRAEEEAMAKEVKEAVKALTSIYNESGGPRFAGLENYIAGKLDACGVVEKHLRRHEGYTKDYLQKWKEYDAGRLGDTFNRGRWEVLSWALARLEENV